MSEAKIKQLTDVNNALVYPVTLADSTYVKKQDENGEEYFDNLNNVINDIYDKLLWKALTINNFKMSPSTTNYEVGHTINSLTFTWDTNKRPITITFNNEPLDIENSNSYSQTLTDVIKDTPGSKSYKVIATHKDKDGITDLPPVQVSTSISWNYYVFYGSCLTSDLDNITLSKDNPNKYLYAATKSGITVNVPIDGSLWIAVQSNYKVKNIVDTANQNTPYQLEVVKDDNGNDKNFTYTLPNGETTNYNIYYRYTDDKWTPTITISLESKK